MSEIEIHYFGTDLDRAGHYLWVLDGDVMRGGGFSCDHLPFHPEQIAMKAAKGSVAFWRGGGYSAIAITGAPSDSRPGTKSVFFVKGTLSERELKQRIKQHPMAKRLIKAMPFTVRWNEFSEIEKLRERVDVAVNALEAVGRFIADWRERIPQAYNDPSGAFLCTYCLESVEGDEPPTLFPHDNACPVIRIPKALKKINDE